MNLSEHKGASRTSMLLKLINIEMVALMSMAKVLTNDTTKLVTIKFLNSPYKKKQE